MRDRYFQVKPLQVLRHCVWLFSSFVLLLSYQTCTDNGVLIAIEDAESRRDGNLSNYIFVHSMAKIGKTVYAGSKIVWQKTDSDGDWSKVSLPSSINTDDTPIVSITAYNGELFVASSKIVYVRNSGGVWVLPFKGNFSSYSLRSAGSRILAIDTSNTVFRYVPAAGWAPVLRNTPIQDFVRIKDPITGSDMYYAASGKNLVEGSAIHARFTTIMLDMPHGDNTITDLLTVNRLARDYMYMLADGKLFVYDVGASTWASKGDNSVRNICMLQVDTKLLVGRFQAGYQIYDLASDSWKNSLSNDEFSDMDSLSTFTSGSSLMKQSLGSFLFYDDADNSKDRIYAATLGNHGLFSAKRKGSLWSWSLE